jgi:hypothetical protein
VSDDKPSIAELQKTVGFMDPAPWVDVRPAVVFQDGPNPVYIADCRGSAPDSNAAGICGLRNAAPVLLEIAAAALALNQTDGVFSPASANLAAALAKVRP